MQAVELQNKIESYRPKIASAKRMLSLMIPNTDMWKVALRHLYQLTKELEELNERLDRLRPIE
uniref:Uncharacterized protein n=1 Tax=viral metagenome TaxID=1070528 RepID=A0A6C0EJG4_9ZZZZ